MINKLALVLSFTFFTTGSISSERAKYTSLLSHSNEMVTISYEIDPTGHIFKGDVGTPAKFCAVNSKFICIISPYLSFSIQKNSSSDEWVMYGWKFKELPTRSIAILNQLIEVQVISAIDLFKQGIRKNSCGHLFLYNKVQGLIADIQNCESEKWNATYFLRNEIGFGSEDFNKSVNKINILTPKKEELVFSNKVDMNSIENMHNCIFTPENCQNQ